MSKPTQTIYKKRGGNGVKQDFDNKGNEHYLEAKGEDTWNGIDERREEMTGPH